VKVPVIRKRTEATMWEAIKKHRLARWAAIAMAINALALAGVFPRQFSSSEKGWWLAPAASVRALCDPDTGKVVQYSVKDIPVDEIVSQAQWPDFGELDGAFGLNVALFGWLLWIAIADYRDRARSQPPRTREPLAVRRLTDIDVPQ
jgi:hypothetical protein